jgi:hypothetical protein
MLTSSPTEQVVREVVPRAGKESGFHADKHHSAVLSTHSQGKPPLYFVHGETAEEAAVKRTR